MSETRIGPGDRVLVSNPRETPRDPRFEHSGRVVREVEETGKLIVQFDDGRRVVVGRSFVRLDNE